MVWFSTKVFLSEKTTEDCLERDLLYLPKETPVMFVLSC